MNYHDLLVVYQNGYLANLLFWGGVKFALLILGSGVNFMLITFSLSGGSLLNKKREVNAGLSLSLIGLYFYKNMNMSTEKKI